MICAVGDISMLRRTTPHPEAGQTEVIWEVVWPMSIPMHLLWLWAWVMSGETVCCLSIGEAVKPGW